MANGNRRPVAPARKLIAGVLGTVAAFVALFGVGRGSLAIVALGLALLVLSVALLVVTAVRGGARAWVAGSAHVVSASEPPANSTYGRCELQIVVDAPGLPAAAVKIRDPRVPVSKWPDAGTTLPIMVAVDDPRHVRIQWDEVLTHAEAAAELADGGFGDDGLDEDDIRSGPGPLGGHRPPAPTRPPRDESDLIPGVDDPTPDGPPDLERSTVELREEAARSRSRTEEPVVVTETSTGPVVEGRLVEHPTPGAGDPRTSEPGGDADTGPAGGTGSAGSSDSGGSSDSSDSAGAGSAGGAGSGGGAGSAAAAGVPRPRPRPRPYRPRAPKPDAAGGGSSTATATPTATTPPASAAPSSAVPSSATPTAGAGSGSGAATALAEERPPPPGFGPDSTPGSSAGQPDAASVTGAEMTSAELTDDTELTDDDALAERITAYPGARPGPAGSIHGVGVTVLISDLDRSVEFYRDMLGFYEIDGGEGHAVLASGDTRLVLRTVHGANPVRRRVVHLNLEVGDVEAAYEELRAKGVRFTYAPRPVSRGAKLELWAAAFRDPDGNGIALTQWRGRERVSP